MEIDIVDAQDLLKKVESARQGQIVEQSEKAVNDEIPEDARFLSRHNQKVIRETKAAQHGRFQNTATAGGVNQNQPPAPPKATSEKTKTQKKYATHERGLKGLPSLNDLKPSFKPAPQAHNFQNPSAGGGGPASSTDDHLKDVPTALQTMLSTREFVYYTYYNRIKDRLRQYWEPKIKEKVENVVRQGRKIASNQDRITKVVIILDSRGTLITVQVVGASGVEDLDQAAVEAFRAAAPFPNPPKGIADEDGKIRIRWDFVLEA